MQLVTFVHTLIATIPATVDAPILRTQVWSGTLTVSAGPSR